MGTKLPIKCQCYSQHCLSALGLRVPFLPPSTTPSPFPFMNWLYSHAISYRVNPPREKQSPCTIIPLLKLYQSPTFPSSWLYIFEIMDVDLISKVTMTSDLNPSLIIDGTRFFFVGGGEGGTAEDRRQNVEVGKTVMTPLGPHILDPHIGRAPPCLADNVTLTIIHKQACQIGKDIVFFHLRFLHFFRTGLDITLIHFH